MTDKIEWTEHTFHDTPSPTMPKWSEELGIRELLHEMAELREHAETVARLVFQLRWTGRQNFSPSLDIDLKWTLEEGTVDVTYYAGQQDNSFSFPIHYLWSDRETIESAEQALADESARKKAEQAAAEEAQRQRVRREQYERLKAEFEQEGKPT